MKQKWNVERKRKRRKKKSTKMPCFKINKSNVPVGTF